MSSLPIVARELRVASRKTVTYWLRFGAAAAVSAAWLATIFNQQSLASVAQLGQNLFHSLSLLAEGGCLATGMFLTADSLSAEKRHDTLGLLFLSNLKAHDVVLGKLAAGAVHAFSALLAIFPLLALPLLSGGVGLGEFWRVFLVLNASLLLSLAAGLFVSAFSHDTRRAVGGVLLILIFLTCVLPTFQGLLGLAFKAGSLEPVLWGDPLFAYAAAFDTHYVFTGGGVLSFWLSLAALVFLGLALLAAASLVLGRVWREQIHTAGEEMREERQRATRFGSATVRHSIRSQRLALNPYYWLASRDRLPGVIAFTLFGSMIALWVCLFLGIFIAPMPVNLEAFSGVLFITLGLNLIFRCLVALEATRRFNDDRQSGALESLLVSPLTPREMIAGQRRALLRHFRWPLVALLVLDAALLWLVNGPDPIRASLGAMFSVAQMYSVIFSGGMVMLVADYFTLAWAGMWLGLGAANHARAVLHALALVWLLPGIAFLFPRIGRGGYFGPETEIKFLTAWFVLCGLNDLIVALWARARLRARFRHAAAGVAWAADHPAKAEAAGA